MLIIMMSRYKAPLLGFMTSIVEGGSAHPCPLSLWYSLPHSHLLWQLLETLPLIQVQIQWECIREAVIEQGARRSMATCLEAFCPNVLISFFFSFNLPRVILALNHCYSSVENAGWLLQSVLSNWLSNKCLLLNVKWDFWKRKKNVSFLLPHPTFM